MRMKTGVQLFTLRKYLRKPENVRPVFERVKAMGAEVVQVSGMCEIDPRELKKISDDTGLPVCITHVPYKKLRDSLEKVAEDHAVFGCSAVGIGMMPGEFLKNADGIKRFCAFLNDSLSVLKKYGMSMNYHNHSFEFRDMEGGGTVYDYLIENTDPGVCFIPDTFWMEHAGHDSAAYIERLSGRINTLHLKDLRHTLGLDIMKPIGEGTLDFAKILETAERSGCGNAVVELDFSRDPYGALQRSLDYIKTVY